MLTTIMGCTQYLKWTGIVDDLNPLEEEDREVPDSRLLARCDLNISVRGARALCGNLGFRTAGDKKSDKQDRKNGCFPHN
jgi:hypothetical protein